MTRGLAALAAGAALAAVWLPDLEGRAGPFPAHMLRHMTLVAVAAPLIVLAARDHLRFVPHAAAAAAFEFAVVWGFHLPRAHGAAQAGGLWFAAEQGLFLTAGVAVWASALPPAAPLAGAGGLLMTSMHMTLLGALLVLAPADLYAEICGRARIFRGSNGAGS